MKKYIIIMFLLAFFTQGQTMAYESGIWPKPKYNKAKIQRQNTPNKKNARTKKLLRQNGLAVLIIHKTTHS